MWKFKLEKPGATVTVDESGENDPAARRVYRDGDEFEIPRGWTHDPALSSLRNQQVFFFETKRRTRNMQTGAMEWSRDRKDIALPVVWESA